MKENRLIFVRELTKRTKHNKKIGLYKCSCGNECERVISEVKNGNTSSCGCLRKELLSKKQFKHGLKHSSEYIIWTDMKRRCYNKKDAHYNNYGGRGIIVCERWFEFINFYHDMGPRPSQEYSINRIDNNGNYCPENCEWATAEQQMNNRTDNHFIEYNNERLTLSQWDRRMGFSPGTLLRRINRGWSVEKSLNTPVKPCNKRLLTYKGKTQTISEWSRETGISIQCLSRRIDNYGWSIERALSEDINR